ncbi:MAG: hypothetical protein DRP45_02585 [Candidatus Zixiibacteriota bacterium]|nr:MAG: hypothetical protein DRP45_02585 [candidate division Zixibacteria bacterium]
MTWRTAGFLLIAIVLIEFSFSECASARVSRSFSDVDVPTRLETGALFIFQNSDSLYLNGQLLSRELDYRFVSGAGYFDLSAVTLGVADTLTVIYYPVPVWMQKSYGRSLPEVSSTTVRPRPVPDESVSRSGRSHGQTVKLSGAKSFRFSARSTGGSDFGQSLDLNIAGELSPGLELSGSVSDRGYNPTYGTANSRLGELDKINLTLKSTRLRMQVGDIAIRGGHGSAGEKSVSGVSVDLSFPRWYVHGAAARPRGRFASFSITGQDGFQGPYQVGSGHNVRAVVPGSERVWLDGKQLERGANKDYMVDYPTGRVTFTVEHPIDSRSRIEVDYEPQSIDFREQLLTFGGGVNAGDSALFLSAEVLREGDDKNQPLAGDLSDSDRAILAEAGDSVAMRSGVTPDTSGAYILVVDSLPDSVFSFVGVPDGDFSVRFSYAGPGNGSYRFLGVDRYEYVGAGQGDYVPQVILPVAQQADYCQVLVGSQTAVFGSLVADVRASRTDANLWSSLDDSDNDAFFYSIRSDKTWQWYGKENSLRFQRRVRQADFNLRERLDRADFARDFMIPVGFVRETDETLHEGSVTISPVSHVSFNSSVGVLDFTDRFDSRRGSAGIQIALGERGELTVDWRSISAELHQVPSSGNGQADTYAAGVLLLPLPSLNLSFQYERDRRLHRYESEWTGARFDRMEFVCKHGSGSSGNGEVLKYEYYVEDSLAGSWERALKRHRLSTSANRRFGDFNYEAFVTYQLLERRDSEEGSFLGRSNLRYHSARNRFTLNTSYTISDERRNARGITYLQVDHGLGDYSREGDIYVPDPGGDYIEVEEILTDQARVHRAEKAFYVSKDWHGLRIRLSSNVEEELKEGGKRSIAWVLPFVTDADQPYLYYMRRNSAVVHALSVQGFYAINVRLLQDMDIREAAGTTPKRDNLKGVLTLKQVISSSYLEQELEMFRLERDRYYSGSGQTDGYKLTVGVRQALTVGEVSIFGSFRQARSDQAERSSIYSSTVGSRIRVFSQGEFRTSVEFYQQQFENVDGVPSYQLTGNRAGDKGAVWSASFDYAVKDGLRMSTSLTGRHSNDRTGRVTARGEVVARF